MGIDPGTTAWLLFRLGTFALPLAGLHGAFLRVDDGGDGAVGPIG